jgi:hypothetical protein
MAPIGFALLALGVVGLIYGILMRMKAGRVTDAPLASTGDVAARGPQVAGPRGAISAQGSVICQQPVIAPVSGTPAYFYEIKVTAEWKDGDTTKTKELDHQKVAAQLAINDGSGPVWVDLREGGDFEPMAKKEMEQSTGLLKGIVGGELVFGQYRLHAGIGNLGTTYKVEEKCLPVQPSLYVCGKLADGGGAITAPSWRSLIVSNQSRDQLLAAATKSSKISLIAGAAAAVVGVALGVAGTMLGSSDAAADTSAGAATATTDPVAAASAEPTDAPTASPASAPMRKPGTTAAKPTTTAATPATTATAATPAAASAAPATTAAATAPAAASPAKTTAAAPTTAAKPATKPTIKLKK